MSDDTSNSGERPGIGKELGAGEIGYARPPRAHQFQKGMSGNPRGRPKKQVQSDAIDVAAVLKTPVRVRQNGKATIMAKKEVTLRKQSQAALGGDRKAIIWLLDQFEKAGLLGRPGGHQVGGVVVAPSGMPFAMACILAQRFGVRGSYSETHREIGRRLYLETRTDWQVKIDDEIGYADLTRRRTS